ncbi:IS21 family transposase, partial [Roseateles saccharophilus]
MPKQRISLRMIKDVIRLKWHAKLSHEQVATALKISKGVVAKYVSLATAAGLDWDTVQDWSEQQLSTALQPRSSAALPIVVPDWARIHRELDRKGMTLMLLWQEYLAANPQGRTWRYTQFCEHYKAFAATLKRSMRQHRRAGEKMFVDYAGSTVPLSDGARAQVFVSAMAASSCVFACATPAQRLEDWIAGMVRALHFYGGVPQLVVPDNATAVIASADRYEPRANDTVQDFARHYGTSVLPARPRSPKDKATAESSVQVVGRWVLARLRHHRFDTVAQVDAAIAELLPSVNDRPFQKLAGSRASVFAELDKPALMPLPPQRYELARFKTVKVHIDYHIEVDGHRYSVPHSLVGQVLEARLTQHGVELLLRGQRVAAHARSSRRGGFTTVDAHMPAAHRAHLSIRAPLGRVRSLHSRSSTAQVRARSTRDLFQVPNPRKVQRPVVMPLQDERPLWAANLDIFAVNLVFPFDRAKVNSLAVRLEGENHCYVPRRFRLAIPSYSRLSQGCCLAKNWTGLAPWATWDAM